MSQITVLINSLLNANNLETFKNQLVPVLQGISSTGGEWTPSISATNDAVVSVTSAFYQYAGGNLCQFAITFDITMDSAQSDTLITISNLPIATNFTNARQAIISANNNDNYAAFVGCTLLTSGSNLSFFVSTQNIGDVLQSLSVVGHYLVLP